MKKFVVTLAALAAVGGVALTPTAASARPWGWGGGWHHRHGGGWGWGLGAGLIGFGLGAAVASSAYGAPYWAGYPVRTRVVYAAPATTEVVYVRPRRVTRVVRVIRPRPVIYRTAFVAPPRRFVRRVAYRTAFVAPPRRFVRRVTYRTGPTYMRSYRRAVYWR